MSTPVRLRHRISVGFLVCDLFLITGLALWVEGTVGFDQLALVGLADDYGLIATGFLYLTLLVSPLAQAFPSLPGRRWWFLARRGLGLSSLVFAVPHALVAFLGPMGGFPGLAFLDPYTGWALVLGLLGLAVLLVLGATANDFSVARLGTRTWKTLHRTVYLLGTLVLLHVVLVGTHFGDAHSLWTLGGLVLMSVLLWLQALRFDRWLSKRRNSESARFGPAAVLTFGLIVAAWVWTVQPPAVQTDSSGARWVVGHHGMILPAPPAPEDKP
jgi:DMSO/TMAO reductase YedYZ heme-binding membrane subunit